MHIHIYLLYIREKKSKSFFVANQISKSNWGNNKMHSRGRTGNTFIKKEKGKNMER